MGMGSSKAYKPNDEEAAYYADNRSVDLNVVQIKYSKPCDAEIVMQIKPTLCKACKAAFNMHSRIFNAGEYDSISKNNPEMKLSDAQKALSGIKSDFLSGIQAGECVWRCEFCYFHNILNEENIQNFENDDVFYLLEQSTTDKKERKGLSKKEDMYKTETSYQKPKQKKKSGFFACFAKKKSKINKDPLPQQQQDENKDNFCPDDTNNIIFCIDVSGSMDIKDNGSRLTRLQNVKQSVIEQISQISKNQPNSKVGLVFFSEKVVMKGDCASNPIICQDLSNFDKLFNDAVLNGEKIFSTEVSKNENKLKSQVSSVKTSGCTALGPGLISSIGLASGFPGSKVIICTDGLANSGIGSLNNRSEASLFYDKCGDVAVKNGVTVSVITIKGNACNVEMLGQLTERTAGQILRVTPQDLSFDRLANDQMIGTNVVLKAFLHSGLTFKNEDPKNITRIGSLLAKEIGNVTAKTQTFIQYRFKTKEELDNDNVDLYNIETVPMQAQIEFKDVSGNKYLRIITKSQFVSSDQTDVEKNANVDVVANHIKKQGAGMALNGEFENVQNQQQQWKEIIDREGFGQNAGEQGKAALQQLQMDNQIMNDAVDRIKLGE